MGETMITISNVITVDHPSEELVKWCKQNLKLRNPEYTKKKRMEALKQNRGHMLLCIIGSSVLMMKLFSVVPGKSSSIF